MLEFLLSTLDAKSGLFGEFQGSGATHKLEARFADAAHALARMNPEHALIIRAVVGKPDAIGELQGHFYRYAVQRWKLKTTRDKEIMRVCAAVAVSDAVVGGKCRCCHGRGSVQREGVTETCPRCKGYGHTLITADKLRQVIRQATGHKLTPAQVKPWSFYTVNIYQWLRGGCSDATKSIMRIIHADDN